jgi:hypothetical protein
MTVSASNTAVRHIWLRRLALGGLLATLVACATDAPPVAVVPKPELQFVDLQGFDRDLYGALSAPLPRVDVAFLDRISPNALPERLQRWMAAVEKGGGVVKVVPPRSSVVAKNPLMLISAISTLWSASRMAHEMSVDAQFKAAQVFDADILLKVDDRGDSVVEKVVFVQRKK